MDLAPNYWQLGCETLKERIEYLIQSGQWSDCKFLVGTDSNKVVIEAHKMILTAASPVFEAMFFSEIAERESVIPIPDIQPVTFRTMLRYIYTDDLIINSYDEAFNIYYAADKYIMPHLKKECVKYLESKLELKYVCRAYEFASLYTVETLKDKCIQYFTNSTQAVLNDNNFEDIQLSTLVTIFSLERIKCTELDLFKAAERYVKVQEKLMESTNFNAATTLDMKLHSPESSLSNDIVVVKVDNEKNNPEGKAESLKQDKGTSPASSLEISKPVVHTSEYKERPNVRAAIQNIRFLNLTPHEFATGPAKSGLLTESEVSAILINIASSSVTNVQMPNGFSVCRVKRTF